jgi:peptide/nickel transport system permease protein
MIERAAEKTGSAAPKASFWQVVRGYSLSLPSLVALVLVLFSAAFAEFFAPYPNWYTNRDLNFTPPMPVYFTDDQGRLTRPYVYHYDREIDPATGKPFYVKDPRTTYLLRFFVRSTDPRDQYVPFPVNLLPPQVRHLFGIHVTTSLRLVGIDAPRNSVPFYLWGSDIVGNCVLSSVLYGGQLSVAIGLAGSLVAAIIGLLLGIIMRAFGGWLDALVMSFYALFSALPSIFLLLALLRYFDRISLPLIIAILFLLIDAAIIDLGTLGRAFRRRIRLLRARPEPAVARFIDVRPPQSPYEHLLQHGLGYVVVIWGMLLATQRSFYDATLLERWWILLPAVPLLLAVTSWNIFGDALRGALERNRSHEPRAVEAT